MKCDICHEKDAIVFIRQVSGSSVNELHLCTDCARVRGFSAEESKIEMSLGNLLSGLVDTTLTQNSKNRACTVCGQLLKDIIDNRRAGCPECYENFKKEIITQLRSDGIDGEYSGSFPRQLAYFKSSLTDRMMLQSKLEKAISEEDYEKAAVYRDRLRVLEKTAFLVQILITFKDLPMNKAESRSPQPNQDAWYSYPGKENDVVLSTRVRLARNLASFPFPHAFRSDDAQRVKSLVFDSFSQMDSEQKYQSLAVKNLDPLGQRILSERGVISPETASAPMSGVIVRNDGKIACTVNTCDHVRISAFVTGLNAQAAFTLCKDVDDNLQNTLQFSASKEFGYLTASLADLGSGMKISVLVHLPSISAAGFLDRIFKDLMAKSYVISGFYGAGNDSGSSLGSYYQISTSNSFTGSEISQIDELSLIVNQIAEFERKTRKEIADNRPTSVRDQVYRALALVKYSRFIGSREGVDLISRIKWGADAGILNGIENSELFALLYRIQTAHLQYVIRTSELKYEKDVVSEEKKIERLRSLIIQEAVAKVQLTA